MKKFFSTLINAISILLLVAASFILLNVILTKPGSVPQVAGYSMLRVLTGSMEPTLPTNSIIITRSTDPEEIEVGDIITFYSTDPALGGAVNTHRVVSVELDEASGKRIFHTKGDANMINDEYAVPEANILGVVVFHSLIIGQIVRIISNPYVFIPLILLPLCVILIMNVVSTIRSTRRLMKESEEEALREALEQYRREHPKTGTENTETKADAEGTAGREVPEAQAEKSTGET